MSNKSFLIYTILFSLLIIISTKEENFNKFLSFSSDNETDTTEPEDKTDAPDTTEPEDTTDAPDTTEPEGGTDSPDSTEPDPEEGEETNNKDKKSSTTLINVKCLYSKGYNIYSLQPLQKDDDYQLERDGNTILFNFCKNTRIVNNATFVQKIEDNYVRLAGSIEGEGNNKNIWNEIKDNNGKGVSIDFIEGDECHYENSTKKFKHTVKLTIYCDSDIEKEHFLDNFTIIHNSNPCFHNYEMRSIHGCTLRSMYLLLKLLNKYNYIFLVLFAIIGIILCFFGNRYINKTIILIGGFIGCYAITAAVLSFFPKFITTELYLFLCLFVSFVLGCVIGYFLKDDIRFSCLLLGASLGFSCATFVYQIVQNYVDFDPEIVYYVCIGVCIVVGAFLGWKLYRYVVIIGTAVLGGYLVMRGISLVAGHYLDESLVIDLLKNEEWEELKDLRTPWLYAYLGTWIILSGAGIYYQWKHKDDKKKKKKKKDIEDKNEKKKKKKKKDEDDD